MTPPKFFCAKLRVSKKKWSGREGGKFKRKEKKNKMERVKIDPKILVAKWKNELGSVMSIEVQCLTNKTFKGRYYTSVGNIEKDQGHDLSGTYQIKPWIDNDENFRAVILLNWSVQWTQLKDTKKPPSSTSWSAQVIFDDKLKLVEINSMYLLRRYSNEKDCWDQPVVGKNVFKEYVE